MSDKQRQIRGYLSILFLSIIFAAIITFFAYGERGIVKNIYILSSLLILSPITILLMRMTIKKYDLHKLKAAMIMIITALLVLLFVNLYGFF